MEKKRRIVSKLIFALVIAAVLSLCFVGTTLARYASGASGSGTVQVAKWNVSFDVGSTSTVVDFGMISPSEKEYTDGGEVRSKESAKTHVATISSNDTDVVADVTVTAGAITFSEEDTRNFDTTIGADQNKWTEVSQEGAPSQKDVADLFSVTLYYNKTGRPSDSVTEIKGATAIELQRGENLYIYAVVTWTSADVLLKGNADALDTWVGTHISGIQFTLTFSAVQGSELPTT